MAFGDFADDFELFWHPPEPHRTIVSPLTGLDTLIHPHWMLPTDTWPIDHGFSTDPTLIWYDPELYDPAREYGNRYTGSRTFAGEFSDRILEFNGHERVAHAREQALANIGREVTGFTARVEQEVLRILYGENTVLFAISTAYHKQTLAPYQVFGFEKD